MTALGNLNVVDVTVARGGPTAVRQLADWGAAVIRVEPLVPSDIVGDHDGSDYLNLHRNKRAIAIDLKQPAGLEILYRLVDRADVFIENFRRPVKHRLGIDYDTLASRNPRLVYGSISGFGQTGPLADEGAVDQIIQGMGGLMALTGDATTGPIRVGIAVADMAAGHQLAIGILTVLLERHESGAGQWVQVSLLEAMVSFLDFQAARWLIDGVVPPAVGNSHPTSTPTGTYAVADGVLNIAAANSRLWVRFCEVIGAPELVDDLRYATLQSRTAHRGELVPRLEAILGTRSSAEWRRRFDAEGIPCGPVYRLDEVFEDEQVEHLAVAVPVRHPVRGEIRVLRQPVVMSRSTARVERPAPQLGEHTDEIMIELGYDAAEIDELRRDQVI